MPLLPRPALRPSLRPSPPATQPSSRNHLLSPLVVRNPKIDPNILYRLFLCLSSPPFTWPSRHIQIFDQTIVHHSMFISTGAVSAVSQASSQALDDAANATSTAVASAIAQVCGGTSVTAAASAVAQATATATAQAVASASAQVTVQGEGTDGEGETSVSEGSVSQFQSAGRTDADQQACQGIP